MRLSKRIQQLKPSATLAVTARVREMRAEGRDVIGFGAGEPDFDTPMNIREAAIEALRAGETHYMPVPGTDAAREVIAEKLRTDNGIACTARDVVISCGAKHSIYLALQCLLDTGAGQEVVVPTPAWVSYRPMIELAGGVVVEVPASIDNDYKITPAQLESAITGRTVALLVNSPSNPCGTMYSPDELRALADVLEGHGGITIISDEIYEKLVYGGIDHLSLGSLPEIAERVITINGMSKGYAMTGWRIGYACSPGQGGLVAGAMAKLQSQMTSNITSFAYPGIIEGLTNSADSVEQMRRTFGERAALIHDRLSAMPGLRCPRPTGAFYAFPDVSAHFGKRTPAGRKISTSTTFAEAMVEEALVAVVPGADFGECGEGHVRLSFACSNDTIVEGCRRIDAWLRTLK